MEEELGIGKDAIIDYYLREICAADLLANSILIGGPSMTVEVDESLFTRRKNHQGRVCDATTVGVRRMVSGNKRKFYVCGA